MNIPDGKVAVRSVSGRTLFHLMRPDLTPFTLCGRYKTDRILPDDSIVPPTTKDCQVCQTAKTADEKRSVTHD